MKKTAAENYMTCAVADNYIACAVCFVRTGSRIPAITVANTYATCADHLPLVSNPKFSLFQLKVGAAV